MSVLNIKEAVESYIKDHSNLDLKREYLGMSAIGCCSKEIYRRHFNSMIPRLTDYRNSYRGYTLENHFRTVLEAAEVLEKNSGIELIAGFDKRFKGHIDGHTANRELIEIKSMASDRWDKVEATGKIPYRNFLQVQAYMKYGSFDSAYVVCINTGTFEVASINIVRNTRLQSELEEKAKMILKCIDDSTEPVCECGRCDGNK